MTHSGLYLGGQFHGLISVVGKPPPRDVERIHNPLDIFLCLYTKNLMRTHKTNSYREIIRLNSDHHSKKEHGGRTAPTQKKWALFT